MRRTIRLALLVGVTLVAALVPRPTQSSASPIATTVTTTLTVFEFNAYFGPPWPTIDCELDHNLSVSGTLLTSAYCMSFTPSLTHNVRLTAAGHTSVCVGMNCGSNPNLGTPTLSPGTRVSSGPFSCDILYRAVTCRTRQGHGFTITLKSIDRF